MGQRPDSLIILIRAILNYYIEGDEMSAWDAKCHVSKLVGIAPQSLCRYLSGERNPDSMVAARFRKVGVSIGFIRKA